MTIDFVFSSTTSVVLIFQFVLFLNNIKYSLDFRRSIKELEKQILSFDYFFILV